MGLSSEISVSPDSRCSQILQPYQRRHASMKWSLSPEALRLALQSFLEDGQDIESPLGMITNDPSSLGLLSDADERAMRERLRELLDDERASLQLLSPTEQFLPERGESIEANWLFRLRMPQTFSSLMWAVVDRAGVTPAYNYGFE